MKLLLKMFILFTFLRFILALVMIEQLLCSGAVDIGVIGIDNNDMFFKAFIHTAPTLASSQSGAKIGEIIAQYPGNETNANVKHLIFWDPDTKYFPFDLFHHFPMVEMIDVGRSFQEMASPINGHFMNAKHLDKLFITNQVFHKMGPNVFEGAIRIRQIYLENNQISNIHEKAFQDVRSVRQLSLQANTINSLKSRTFEKLLELELINLRNNLLTTLPSDVFAKNMKLKTLMVDTNRLLFIENLELIAPFEKFILLDNLCVNEDFTRIADLNKYASKHCDIEMTPNQLFKSYKEQQKNLHLCNDKDIDEMSKLKEQIRAVELEIEQLKAVQEKLTDIFSAVETLQYCHVRDEYEM